MPARARAHTQGPRAPNATLVTAGAKMLMGMTRANYKLRFKVWRTGLMAQLVVMGRLMLEAGHVDALEAVLQALTHFAQGRNEEASDDKPRLLRDGGLELMLAVCRRHPLHFGVKRECCLWALAMVTGRNGHWKEACKDALRLANLTDVAAQCCEVRSHCQGGKRSKAVNALKQLQADFLLHITRAMRVLFLVVCRMLFVVVSRSCRQTFSTVPAVECPYIHS